jgi:hypothetical protein
MANDYSENPFRGSITQTGANTYEASPTIIKDVTAARTVYTKLRSNHLRRIALYAEIAGLINGVPPYDPVDMHAAGLQHVANFNDLSTRATIKRACLAYWNLLHNSEVLVRFEIRPSSSESPRWADTMARCWDKTIRVTWPSFLINIASLQKQIVELGVSPALFPDERDPRWRVVELARFFVPDQQQSDLDMLTTCCVESEFTIQYLWSVYQEFKENSAYKKRVTKKNVEESGLEDPQKETPWNLEELGQLLCWVGNTNTKDSIQPNDMYEMERKLYTGDISFDRMFNDTVRIVSLFQKEYDGKISHYMFHRYWDNGQFLFFQQNQYESMNEALVLFTRNPGEFTIHGNLGLGHEVFSLSQANTMLHCSLVDLAKWSSTPLLKSPSLSTKDIDQIKFYPGVPTNLGPYEYVQNNLGSNINGVIGAAQYVQSLLQYNMTYSGSDSASPDPDTGSVSPSQARLQAFHEWNVIKNDVQHFYSSFDKLVQNMTAKMLYSKEGYPGYEIAKEWIDRCVEEGVPIQIFEAARASADAADKRQWRMPRTISVFATRAAGAGSQVGHLIGLQEIGEVLGPSFGPREELAFKRDFISATIGPEQVDRYLRPEDEADEMSGGASLAGVENAIMQAGKAPVFSMDNDHRAHFVTHMALNTQIIQQVQQRQMDVVEADSIMNVCVPHTGEHFNALARDPFAANFVAQVKEGFGQVSKWAALNRKNAAKVVQARLKQQQEQQEKQQQAMNDDQLKTMQAINDEKRKDAKLAAQSQRQEQAGEAKKAALQEKTSGELAIKRQKAEGEVEIARTKAQGDLVNRAVEDSERDPAGYLRGIGGETPSPNDIESGEPIV